MKVNVYLSDELGKEAKELNLPFSQLLQAACYSEIDRHKRREEGPDPKEYELDLEDDDGGRYVGRLTGHLIAEDVYLTDDDRLISYDPERLTYYEIDHDDAEEQFENHPEFREILHAIGVMPHIDI